MSTASTSFKLGLFTLLTLGAVALVAAVLGLRGNPEHTIEHHSYFDESVVGLEVGAPVKLRGITIGTVSRVGFAPSSSLVDVTYAIQPDADRKVKWSPDADTGIRAQVASQGITGVKLIDIDVVDPAKHPPPKVPIALPPRYIPATRSLLTQIEEGAAQTAQRLPEILDIATDALHRLDVIFADLGDHDVPARLEGTLRNVNEAVGELRGILRRIDRGSVGGQSVATLDRLDAAIASFGRVMDHLDGDGGLLTSTQRAAEMVNELGRSANGTSRNLDATLRDIADAARSIREVADAVDRDPEILLKGRSKARSR